MSLQSLLSIARSALLTQQQAMNVTGHNVANANTVGYTRQRLVISAATPLAGPLFPVGRGVTADAIQRTRSDFFDATYRQGNGALGQSSTMSDYLSQIEATLNEPSDNGLGATMDGLFKAFGDLASDPASTTNRSLVVSAANRMISQFHGLDSQLTSTAADATTNLKAQVDQVNVLTKQIADLNHQIQATGGANHVAPDLMDQRDNLIDQLSQLVQVRVNANSDGSVGVLAGGTLIVDGGQVTALNVATVGAGSGVFAQGGATQIDLQGGSIKALTDLTQSKIPAVRAQLDQLAQAFVTEVNRLHSAGFTPGGTSGIDFFDPTRLTASSIQLSSQVQASTSNIAVSATNAPGNGDIATQIAALSTTGVASLGGQTMRDDYTTFAAGVGLDVQSAQQDVSAQQTLVSSSDQARQSVSGVSVDDEMISLLGEQQAYAAAARLVTAANDMMTTVMNMLTTV